MGNKYNFANKCLYIVEADEAKNVQNKKQTKQQQPALFGNVNGSNVLGPEGPADGPEITVCVMMHTYNYMRYWLQNQVNINCQIDLRIPVDEYERVPQTKNIIQICCQI